MDMDHKLHAVVAVGGLGIHVHVGHLNQEVVLGAVGEVVERDVGARRALLAQPGDAVIHVGVDRGGIVHHTLFIDGLPDACPRSE